MSADVPLKRLPAAVLIVCLLTLLLGEWTPARASAVTWKTLDPLPARMDPALQARLERLQDSEPLTVIVTLRQQADLSRVSGRRRGPRLKSLVQLLQSTAGATQGPLRALLQARLGQGRVQKFASLWIVNGFSVTAAAEVIAELGRHPDVHGIAPDEIEAVPAYEPSEPNVAAVNAPALWSLGYTGQGVVVASMDTGVDIAHPDLAARWRGGPNSWFDPYGEHPTPADLSGHGTWTMGVMVGGDGGGTTVGMAPGAQWIAVKIFNDAGLSTATAVHQGFQWLLDPDGDPSTDDAPHVLNSSWTLATPGCTLDFEPDLRALRAAGILPVFAAGNYGPYADTSRSPANNPSAFPVGNINDNDLVYSTSSRGPSACPGWSGPYPRLVAPGVTIRTTDLYGGYYDPTGTSLAAPHAAGALALLLSAYPDLTAARQEDALTGSAVDLGTIPGPDDTYGYGRLDVLAALNLLGTSPAPTGTPTETPLPTESSPAAETPASTATATHTETASPTSTDTPTQTSTATETLTPTDTPTSTATPSHTPSQTPTPTATPAYSFGPLYLSLASNQTVAGLASSDEDILAFDGQRWSLLFDGSDVGVGGSDLFAFALVDEDTLLVSFNSTVSVSGISAAPQDVLRFDASSLGGVTAGTFSLYFDGSDVGLSTSGEAIDALALLPEGRLLLSTSGSPSVPGLSTGRDEDVLAFAPSSLGSTTAGAWSLYFDGSDVGLGETSDEDVDALDVTPGGDIYLSTLGSFAVPGLAGADADVLVCAAASSGDATVCNYSSSLYFDGSDVGLSANDVDAIHVPSAGPMPTSHPTSAPTQAAAVTFTPTAVPTVTATHTPTALPSPTAPSTQAAATLTFTAAADSYVSASRPASNYGASTTLRADASPDVRSYLRFDLQGLNGTVRRATLRVFANTASSQGCSAYSLSGGGWAESTITYSSAPGLQAPLGSSGGFGAGAWISIDVTALITGDGVYDLALTTPGSTAIGLSSRESGARAPRLVIETGP